MKKTIFSVLTAACITVSLLAGCGAPAQKASQNDTAQQSTEAAYEVTGIVGQSSDYSDPGNWINIPEITKDVDTFYIYPTVYINPSPDAPSIVPIEDEMMRTGARRVYRLQASAFEESTNVFAPYYRQSNLAALAGKNSEEFMAFQYNEQRTDIYGALDYYFKNYNNGRPFILAGHSQGSMMLKIALRDYFKAKPELLDRMVAAYVIGFSITKEDLESNPALRFAERADDTGVIVSWNTEGPENKDQANVVVQENAIAINPINWKRDDTYAPAKDNLGGIIGDLSSDDIKEVKPGLADAQVDTERGVVICTTMPEYYVKVNELAESENLFGPASLHTSDYGAYYYNIMENVKTRIAAYFAK